MSMKLAILGLLLEKNMHPYEIVMVMRDRSMDRIMKLQMGSLYYAVDNLAKDGYIEALETIRSSDRPDKTVYSITETGRALFEQLLTQQLRRQELVLHPMYPAIVFSRHIAPEKIASLLEERIRETEHEVNLAYQVYEEHVRTVPRSALHLMYGRYEHMKTELEWLRRLHQDAREGRLNEIGQPLGPEL
ncbi:PadR family transcriptional regulator [Paenibacillus spiritus]|uniref:PadR family transcriptional regulator n=1 Tax=Paenibacillus spiritus TaxID=2496557 RepID=A0A5J5G2P3_9BACL|nr:MULTISPECIES: PadR family transcriptional regulator [Paenibacillus]KAA9000971.1 PadR family transcriptional regulator [Paenibacillus spiritus]